MALRNRILLDRMVAAPVAGVLNLAAAVLGKLLRRDHSVSPERTRHVVIAKLVGMGSIVQAGPLLRALRVRYPEARLTFVTLRSNREILERMDVVDEMLCLDDSSHLSMLLSTLRTLARLLRARVDQYLDLEVYSSFAGVLALCSLARNRLGLYRYTAKYKLGIYTHLVYFNTRLPVRRSYLQLGHALGASIHDDDIGRLAIVEADREALHARLPALHGFGDRPYVVLNPNASDLLLERRWPPQHVIEAATELVRQKVGVVLIGAPGECAYVQGIHARIDASLRAGVIDAAGRLTIGQLLALMEGAGVVLTNDSGPMHMAIAIGAPTVCLFGPCSPDHYGMERDYVETFYAAVPCSPCVHEVDEPPCHGDNVCMQRLEAGDVVRAVMRLLQHPHSDQRIRRGITRLPVLWTHPDGHSCQATPGVDPLATRVSDPLQVLRYISGGRIRRARSASYG